MADEARAMLDALMGGDRDAPIPEGSTSSTSGNKKKKKKKRKASSSDDNKDKSSSRPALLPGQRRRSCYDTDICPLYCAWGVDVYDLFTNTKSDLGPNQYIVDEDARNEYQTLPQHEKDRLGYDRMLFRKLQDLVRGCDRVVRRNQDKLKAEIARQQRKSGGGGGGDSKDAVTNVPEEWVKQSAESMAWLDILEEEVGGLVKELEDVDVEEEGNVLVELEMLEGMLDEGEGKNGEGGEEKGSDSLETSKRTEKEESSEGDPSSKSKPKAKHTEKEIKEIKAKIEKLKTRLPPFQSKRSTLLTSLEHKINEMQPIRESLESSKRQLYYVRSDTTSDKTVCEVSGNFMSSRDADERIAAHYAGKQYVGWKMVRDKLRELQKRDHGRGPPGPPDASSGNRAPPGGRHGGGGYQQHPQQQQHPRGGGGNRGGGPYGGPHPPGGYGYDYPPHPPGAMPGGGGGGGYYPQQYHHPHHPHQQQGYGYNQGWGGRDGYRSGPPGAGVPQDGKASSSSKSSKDRSRSRDRDHDRSSRSRRSPSPAFWERDRGGGSAGGGVGGSSERGYEGSSSSSSRRRDRSRRRR